jgi:hypothetical protein
LAASAISSSVVQAAGSNTTRTLPVSELARTCSTFGNRPRAVSIVASRAGRRSRPPTDNRTLPGAGAARTVSSRAAISTAIGSAPGVKVTARVSWGAAGSSGR